MDLLRHLRYFVAVAEELHFGKAAKRLHMSQPPLSQRIAGLEQELGVQLLSRSSRRVTLTPAGETLLAEARDLLAATARLRTTMDELRDGRAGTLRAAMPRGTPAPLLAAVVRAFGERRPGVELHLREATTVEQVAALKAGRIDAALVRRPAPLEGLRRGASFAAPLDVLLPAARASRRRAVALTEVAGMDLVTAPRADAPERYDALLATCHAHGFAPRRVHETTDTEFLYGLLLAGGAVAFAEPGGAERDGIVRHPLAGRPLRATLTTAWHPDAADGAAAAFADAVAAALEAAGGWSPGSGTEPGTPAPRPAWLS
jgi:DNA-binding transcriptional LysR family regulator